MTDSVRRPPSRRARRLAAAATAAGLAAAPAAVVGLSDGAAAAPTPPTFQRINLDTGVSGASFTSIGSVYAGETDIVTSGYGPLAAGGKPSGGGTVQVYRPTGPTLNDWTKVTVFDASANIIFPNASTVADVDGDGDNDIIVPSGYFFDTDPASPQNRGAITWWENAGVGQPFARHDVVTAQPWSYHGVQLVDLDKDGIKDIVTVGEQAKKPQLPNDDLVEPQFFKGLGGGDFAPAVALGSQVGGSQPVVADVDGDGDLDIISSQYFDTFPHGDSAPTFLWLENTRLPTAVDPLAASDFTARTIATLRDTAAGRGAGLGFQIQPIVGFREPGKVSWIGTNHVNRCTMGTMLPIREQVIEFVPGADIRAPWSLTTLSDPATPGPACPSDYDTNPAYQTFSSQITSRYGNGQGAPGVFGAGDLDGDGDIDLAVSGDGDRRLWWIEQQAGGATALHQLTEPQEHFGQSGGGAVADFNGDGRNEMVFSSFDRNTVALWVRRPAAPTPAPTTPVTPVTPVAKLTIPSTLQVGPEARTVRAGKKASWTIRLAGAPGGTARKVSVVFDPKAKGRSVKVGTVTLRSTGTDGVQRGSFAFKARKAGRLVVTYTGTTVSTTLSDTRAVDTARVLIRRR